MVMKLRRWGGSPLATLRQSGEAMTAAMSSSLRMSASVLPYDATKVFVRTPDGWVTVPWTHLPMVSALFAEFTCDDGR